MYPRNSFLFVHCNEWHRAHACMGIQYITPFYVPHGRRPSIVRLYIHTYLTGKEASPTPSISGCAISSSSPCRVRGLDLRSTGTPGNHPLASFWVEGLCTMRGGVWTVCPRTKKKKSVPVRTSPANFILLHRGYRNGLLPTPHIKNGEDGNKPKYCWL